MIVMPCLIVSEYRGKCLQLAGAQDGRKGPFSRRYRLYSRSCFFGRLGRQESSGTKGHKKSCGMSHNFLLVLLSLIGLVVISSLLWFWCLRWFLFQPILIGLQALYILQFGNVKATAMRTQHNL